MNQDTPKNPDMNKIDASDGEGTSRRRVLTGGVAAVVGAATTGFVVKDAKAAHQNCGVHEANGDPVADPDHSDPQLKGVIMRAWNSAAYRNELLGADHARAKRMLENEGVTVPSNKPKVISQGRYNAGYTRATGELVYVLPDYPDVGGIGKGVQARVAMAAVPFGM